MSLWLKAEVAPGLVALGVWSGLGQGSGREQCQFLACFRLGPCPGSLPSRDRLRMGPLAGVQWVGLFPGGLALRVIVTPCPVRIEKTIMSDKENQQKPHFRTYSRRAFYDLSQTLYGDRARRARQRRCVIHFSIQRVVFPTGCTEKFGLFYRRAVSQQ